jgi:hypothetical protein
MSSQIAYFCPQCHGPEVSVEARAISMPNEGEAREARCKMCGWNGKSSDLIGAITPENASFWNAEKVANTLTTTMARQVGPVIQCLQFLGLCPQIPELPANATDKQRAQRQDALNIRDELMRSVVGAAVTAAFETAASLVPDHYAFYDDDPTEGESARVFSYAEHVGVPNDN